MVFMTAVYKQHHLGQLRDIDILKMSVSASQMFSRDGHVTLKASIWLQGLSEYTQFPVYTAYAAYFVSFCIRLQADSVLSGWHSQSLSFKKWLQGRSASAWRVLPTASRHFPSQGPVAILLGGSPDNSRMQIARGSCNLMISLRAELLKLVRIHLATLPGASGRPWCCCLQLLERGIRTVSERSLGFSSFS